MKSIEEIRAAFLEMHHVAMGKEASYMSIPANPQRDADLIVSAAIEELKELREYQERMESAIAALEPRDTVSALLGRVGR